MNKRFTNKVALITGGASGIGLATCERLLREGASVMIADLNQETGQNAVAMFTDQGFGSHVRFQAIDVAQEPLVNACTAATLDAFGRLDIAFLNAGVGGAFGPIADLTEDHWDETFRLLVRSVFLGIKSVSGPMKTQGSGSIVATSSVAGLSGGAGGHPYSASKSAVISLVRTAAIELAPHRIRVNSVAPGLISTPLVHRGDERKIPPVSSAQPWPDRGQPEHIASTVAFLASDDAAFITGETITVDGGALANGASLWQDNIFVSGRSGMNRGSTGLKPTINT